MAQQVAQTRCFRGIQRPGSRGVEFVTSVQRHQVNVNMRHPEPLDHNANADCGRDRLQSGRQPRRRRPECVIVRRIHVKQVVGVTFRDYQQVTGIEMLQREKRRVRGIFK